MGITFPSICHALRTTSGKRIPLGHLHELLAAALGYKSYAAYKASAEEAPSFDGAQHVVLDVELLTERLGQLGYVAPAASESMIAAIGLAFQSHLPSTKVHRVADDIKDYLQDDVADGIENSGQYSGEIAITNATGGDFDLEFDLPASIEEALPTWVVHATGTSSLDQDPDSVHHGDVIDVSAMVSFMKLGRRVLGEMTVEDVGAAVRQEATEEEPEESDSWAP